MHVELKNDLLSLIPRLRAFAFCLVQDLKQADELVCSCLAELWLGTPERKNADIKVAAFGALHRQFLQKGSVERVLATKFEKRPLQTADDSFASRFMRLPRTARAAVSLTQAWGFSFYEAACICDCDCETIGRRVAMACRHLDGRSSLLPMGKTTTHDAKKAKGIGLVYPAPKLICRTDQ